MPMPPAQNGFDAQFDGDSKEVFRGIIAEDLARGGDAVAQARAYAERGKPEFALAYLLASALADEEKREVYAHAYERRAEVTEQRAREFDHQFHRSFAMLFTEAGKDRAAAQCIRAGRSPNSGAGRQLPVL
jgi:hypothetical protein